MRVEAFPVDYAVWIAPLRADLANHTGFSGAKKEIVLVSGESAGQNGGSPIMLEFNRPIRASLAQFVAPDRG